MIHCVENRWTEFLRTTPHSVVAPELQSDDKPASANFWQKMTSPRSGPSPDPGASRFTWNRL